MRLLYKILGLALALGLISGPALAAPAPSCSSCHADWAKTLPAQHPKTQGTLAACVKCHQPAFVGKKTTAKSKAPSISARMHRAHVAKLGECNACHDIKPDRSFGLNGVKGSWGSFSEDELALMKDFYENAATATDSSAAVHSRAKLGCATCHGTAIPKEGAKVANATCESCHGKQAEIAKKTVPVKIPTSNPHESHQGDIACGICHKPHAKAASYCNTCHEHFAQVMPESKPGKAGK